MIPILQYLPPRGSFSLEQSSARNKYAVLSRPAAKRRPVRRQAQLQAAR